MLDTVIVSDMHLSDAELPDPRRPLWKAYKRREFFFDEDFARLLEYVMRRAEGELELVLNGDIFDFDDILAWPSERAAEVDFLARRRGLGSQEWMSEYKISRIITDHRAWFTAVGDFVKRGHKAVFVIGNHDLELNWPVVQERVRAAMGFADLPTDARAACEQRVVFCPWFYMSGGDTYVSHGHQYDPFCTTQSPIDPLINIGGRPHVRLPFGDLAGRYMLGGMGYFNPHASSNYIMSATEYVRFFVRYMLRTQPLLIWTWFWGAMATLLVTFQHFLLPAMRDPLLVDDKVQSIADRAQTTPSIVRRLNALHVPPAAHNPLRVLRELWLDRALILLLIIYVGWQIVLTVNIVAPVSPWWAIAATVVLLPALLFYHFSVKSAVFAEHILPESLAQMVRKITGVQRIVFGHTHLPESSQISGVHYLNSGFWSPAFSDPQCNVRIGTQTFVWIREGRGGERVAELLEWPRGAEAPAPFSGSAGAEVTPAREAQNPEGAARPAPQTPHAQTEPPRA